MNKHWYRVYLWFAFVGINLAMAFFVNRCFTADPQVTHPLWKGLWISASANGLYLLLWTGPWATPKSRIIRAAAFLPMLHLLMNLWGILVFYQIGGLQDRHTGLGFVMVVLVHLVFVKWALLSILRPRSEQGK